MKRLHYNFHLYQYFILITLLFGSCATPSILVTREQTQGDALFNKHNYQEAVKHYDQMLGASRKLGIYRNMSMEADVHLKIANCYEMMGSYEKALPQVRTSMELDSADNNLLGWIRDFREEGKIFIYMGSYNSGITSIEKSLALSDGMELSLKNTHRLTIADNYLALGQLYSVLGKLYKSMDYANKALTIFKQAADRRGEMESYLNLGSIFSDLGDAVSAKNFTNQSLKIAVEDNMGTSRHYQLLATIASSQGEYEDALRDQEKALQDASKFRILGQIVWATVGMGDIYRELGDTKKAERYYRQAREIKDTVAMQTRSIDASLDLRLGDEMSANEFFRTEGSLTGAGISSLRLAEMFIRDGIADSASHMLEQAGSMFLNASNMQGIASVQVLRGRLLVNKGDFSRAKPVLDSASKVNEFPETAWQAWYQLGRMYEGQGDDAKAMESYMKSIGVIEKIRGNLTIDEFKSIYFDSKREVYDRLINMLLKNNKPVEAFDLSEQARARAFYDILSNKKINFRGTSSDDLVSQEQEKRIEMQKLYRLLQKENATNSGNEASRSVDMRQVRSSLTEVQTEYEDILQKIKLSNPAYAEMVAARPVALADVQSRLDPKTAALEYWISANHIIIWLVTHSEIITRNVEINQKDLETLIGNTRRSIENNSKADYTINLQTLHKLLIGPVESSLAAFSNLVIIPNQSLHFVPFQALMNVKGEYLVQKYSLVYSPSASVFVLCNDKIIKSGTKFMGMALSDVEVGNNPGLPGTTDELKKILPIFPDNLSSFGNQSTETFARKNAGNYNFLHFATHGSYNYRQPLYSYLLFPPSDEDDGRLNVFEVFEMNLNSRLVTLSACETGLGNISQGDELTGLSRAFLFAGSASVIVSLWSVADYPTALLMTNFYKYLKDHSMQESLALAQRDVMKLYPDPVYWSPFILIGNGNITGN